MKKTNLCILCTDAKFWTLLVTFPLIKWSIDLSVTHYDQHCAQKEKTLKFLFWNLVVFWSLSVKFTSETNRGIPTTYYRKISTPSLQRKKNKSKFYANNIWNFRIGSLLILLQSYIFFTLLTYKEFIKMNTLQ